MSDSDSANTEESSEWAFGLDDLGDDGPVTPPDQRELRKSIILLLAAPLVTPYYVTAVIYMQSSTSRGPIYTNLLFPGEVLARLDVVSGLLIIGYVIVAAIALSSAARTVKRAYLASDSTTDD